MACFAWSQRRPTSYIGLGFDSRGGSGVNKLNSVQPEQRHSLTCLQAPRFSRDILKAVRSISILPCASAPNAFPGLGCTRMAMLVSFSECGRPVLRLDEVWPNLYVQVPLLTPHYVLLLEHAIPPRGDENSMKSKRRRSVLPRIPINMNDTLTDRAVGDGKPIPASGSSDFDPRMPSDVQIVQEPQAKSKYVLPSIAGQSTSLHDNNNRP